MPDPRQGVFETLLVLDGRPVEWDAHLARLDASLTDLYPQLPPPLLAAPALDAGVVRITVAPDVDGKLTTTIEHRPASGHFATENGGKVTTGAVSLRSLQLPGGLGAHKWADRALLDEAQAELPDDALPLIVSDGDALEASRANVFAVRGGVLFTPPLDGRILPGVTRLRALELAESIGIGVSETPLTRDDLLGADEVFLTGSVRGIESATSLDGAPLAGAGEIAERLAAELRRAWAGLSTAASFG